MGAMHSEEVSERIPTLILHTLQDGRFHSYDTEQIHQITLAHPPNSSPIPRTAAQQLNYGPFPIPETNFQIDTLREPKIDPTKSEDTNESGITNGPYRPYPATYSFDQGPPIGFGHQMEPHDEYSRSCGPSFHASSYGHQPVEQHYDNTSGGQEHQGQAGLVEYHTSSYRRMTQ